ncbi:hypothetical protein LEP1GSC170_6244 [Leptospira interrogans serovar Bataviae str. HAI135]|nr:hypothetical protein LEP1GSC170_6244 [Leptospira interrogans serovar Bataviae str. HAI135]
MLCSLNSVTRLSMDRRVRDRAGSEGPERRARPSPVRAGKRPLSGPG